MSKKTKKENEFACQPVDQQAPVLHAVPFHAGGAALLAGFSGRAGGISKAPCESLNFSFFRGDDDGAVLENHRRLATVLGCETTQMVRAVQVHGNKVVRVGQAHAGIFMEVHPDLNGVDGLVTDVPGLVLLTSHADCLPLYLYDPVHGAIGLAHAGWAGILAGVVQSTIHAMQDAFGTRPEQLQAGIGPHIHSCCFEVQEDVASLFQAMEWWRQEFLTENGRRTTIDLTGSLKHILEGEGIPAKAIWLDSVCTCCEKVKYFSHRGSGKTGTGVAWLSIPGGSAKTLSVKQTAELTEQSSQKNDRKILTRLVVGCLLLVAVLLSGCTLDISSFGDEWLPQGPEAGSPSEEAVREMGFGRILLEDAGPSRGGTLRLFMMEPDHLDPLQSMDPYVMDYGWFVYDPLVQIDEAGRVTAYLAKTLQSGQEGRVWDITLREGVVFHDGMDLTAADVIFSLEHARKAGSEGPYSAGLRNLDSATAIGLRKVRLVLRMPDASFTQNLCFPIMSERSYRPSLENEDPHFAPIGTGAFQFDSLDEEGLSLIRHEAWFQALQPGGIGHVAWPDGIRFLFGKSDEERLLLFQQRHIDIAWVQAADVERYRMRTDLEMAQYDGNRMEFAVAGARSQLLQNEVIRDILFRYLAGRAMEGGPAGKEVVEASDSPLDRDTAIELLVEAGCRYQQLSPERQILSFRGPYGMRQASVSISHHSLNPERIRAADWIIEALSLLGINGYRQEIDEGISARLIASGQFDLMLLGIQSPLRSTPVEMMEQMEEALGKNASVAGLLPLYREQRLMLYNARIRGVKTPVTGGEYGGWQQWYLLESAAIPDVMKE